MSPSGHLLGGMEEYRASIESVDSALNRLNQTLTAMKLSQRSVSTDAHASRANEAVEVASAGLSKSSGGVQNMSPDARSSDPGPGESLLPAEVLSLRANKRHPEKLTTAQHLAQLARAQSSVVHYPHCMPLHLFTAIKYLGLGYPDLAAGAAYKALLLCDALGISNDEYHEAAMNDMVCFLDAVSVKERYAFLQAKRPGTFDSLTGVNFDSVLEVEVDLWIKEHFLLILYRVLIRSLILCDCLKSAHVYLSQIRETHSADPELLELETTKYDALKRWPEISLDSFTDWPDGGFVRREVYAWNDHEVDRLTDLDVLNSMMAAVAPKLEVRAVDLPALGSKSGTTVTQLGVFATEDIAAGETILTETSLLTANNKLQDALCDACSTDLPTVTSPAFRETIACPDCEVVFCSQACYDLAAESYHPALCGQDIEAIAKDGPRTEAADELYALLLLRTLAMAETQDVHPLDLAEVKYIWGDFDVPTLPSKGNPYADLSVANSCAVPRTLPWSFKYNLLLPLHMLEKLDVDIFAAPQYDVWVLNTLYAKFRGTASARLTGAGGGIARGPEVSAVHPMWCLANHSCDPNVGWEWGGAIRFWCRETDERVLWEGSGGEGKRSRAGIRKGEEIMNHYCDVELPVKERREWARGALGGECRCGKCLFDAAREEIEGVD